jgi:hypothetical protein
MCRYCPLEPTKESLAHMAKGFADAKAAIEKFAKTLPTQNRFELNRHERRKVGRGNG